MNPELWFEYVFGTVFAVGAAVLILFFIAAMAGFFDQ